MASEDMLTGYLAGQNEGGNNGFGNCGDWIWIILILALLGGNGFGFGGGFGGGMAAPWATQADVRAAVDQQTLISKLDQQTYGLADSTYALNNAITNGFHGVERGLCDLGHQISDCCCTTQRSIDQVRFDMSKGFCDLGNHISNQTRDLIDNQNANARQIMDFLVNSKIEGLQAENSALKLKASQLDQNAVIRAAIDASTAEIIRRTGNECPVPAYVVPNPNCCYGNPVGVGYAGYGYNNGGCACA